MVWIIVIVILAVLVIWAISSYNSFITWKNKVEEAFSTMDVYLKKRYDMIPNLVETVKGYAKHESETLEAVINARNAAASATTMEGKIEAEKGLSGVLGRLFALTESYPDLKANQNFIELQTQIKQMEEEIANSRKYYNGVVKEYNTRCEMFPSSIIASIFNFKKQPMFVVSDETQRENVKVQF
ncbi:LemA family protein [Anaerorhabdus furcosa]|uniref:LemA protein n=1 Tax=Anaerorhabdus furcosa TaxID=118967 RepID=A0A1T4L4S9_9FIRM|nr:LemA family protein [Anaerorhabdus furcosa]SJZ49510.1 LemA protein [Anaerorhabdus furcosa]